MARLWERWEATVVTINDLLRDEAIRHQVALQGLSNNVVARIIATLNRSDKRILIELAERLERMDANSFSIQRLESMLTSVRSLNTQAFYDIERELTAELRDFVAYETSYQAQMLMAHVPVGVHVASVSADVAYTAAMARPFQGVLLKEVWRDLDATQFKRVRQAIASGFVEGKTTDAIIRELRGTRARGYADGILEATRRDAEAVTRTALGHMARSAQDKAIEANVDLIKALGWSSTLDLRTTPICRIRDGKQYTPAHNPIGHSLPWLGGPGAAHWRCRSHATLVLKSHKELGIDVPEIVVVGKQRASMDGQVAAETTYPEWLRKQSAARQIEVLGPTRAKLMNDGKLPIERMYSQNGRYLTLDQLREQDAEAFKRAGV